MREKIEKKFREKIKNMVNCKDFLKAKSEKLSEIVSSLTLQEKQIFV